MRIIGIDPGLSVTGYGVIDVEREGCVHVRHGVFRTKPAMGRLERLVYLRDAVRDISTECEAMSGAIEAGFVGQNMRAALALGEARAAALLGLADAKLEVVEYAPAMVKQTVSGYGRGDKAQIGQMVRLQLGLATVPAPEDAADALAVAITHWAHLRLSNR
jgi:crossover junction endodeoxyribonuclease RuvC